MLILYDLTTKEIKGVSMILNDSSKKIPEPTLRSSFPKQRTVPNTGSYIIPNDELIANELYNYKLKFDDRGNPTGIVKIPPRPRIELSTDAPDIDENGLAELPADGESKTSIIATIVDENGNVITTEDYEIHFKTTGGILLDRTAKTKKGVAKTMLQSVTETLRLTITASAEGCRDGLLEFEFVNPSATTRRIR